jgi:hypothetical protein
MVLEIILLLIITWMLFGLMAIHQFSDDGYQGYVISKVDKLELRYSIPKWVIVIISILYLLLGVLVAFEFIIYTNYLKRKAAKEELNKILQEKLKSDIHFARKYKIDNLL